MSELGTHFIPNENMIQNGKLSNAMPPDEKKQNDYGKTISFSTPKYAMYLC